MLAALAGLGLDVGASTLVGRDLVARLALRVLGTEPPVGEVTARIGGPAFLVVHRESRAQGGDVSPA